MKAIFAFIVVIAVVASVASSPLLGKGGSLLDLSLGKWGDHGIPKIPKKYYIPAPTPKGDDCDDSEEDSNESGHGGSGYGGSGHGGPGYGGSGHGGSGHGGSGHGGSGHGGSGHGGSIPGIPIPGVTTKKDLIDIGLGDIIDIGVDLPILGGILHG